MLLFLGDFHFKSPAFYASKIVVLTKLALGGSGKVGRREGVGKWEGLEREGVVKLISIKIQFLR